MFSTIIVSLPDGSQSRRFQCAADHLRLLELEALRVKDFALARSLRLCRGVLLGSQAARSPSRLLQEDWLSLLSENF